MIITGLCQQNRGVSVMGPNLGARVKDEKSSVFISVSRIQRMVPASTANLDAFIAALGERVLLSCASSWARAHFHSRI